MTRMTADAAARMNAYLADVSEAMRAAGAEDADTESVTDSLRDHVTEAVAGLEKPLAEAADMDRILSALDPPQAFATPFETERAGQAPPAADTVSRWLGLGSVAVMGLSFVLGLGLSNDRPFDNDLAGTLFVFGQMIALAAGLCARKTRLGAFGAIASGSMLAFLAVVALIQAAQSGL